MEYYDLIEKELVDIKRSECIVEVYFGKSIMCGENNSTKFLQQYQFNINCPFRVEIKNQIVIGNYDIYTNLQGTDEERWNEKEYNMFDKIVDETIKPLLPIKVIDITLNEFGDVEITLQNHVVLRIFINAEGNEDYEFWWLSDTMKGIDIYYEGKYINRYE